MHTGLDHDRPLPGLPPALPGKVLPGLELALLDIAHPQRGMAEAFVQAIFRAAYQARLSSFYPQLLTITRADGTYVRRRPAKGDNVGDVLRAAPQTPLLTAAIEQGPQFHTRFHD